MRVWRMVAKPYADSALTGTGAARYGGRWNSIGRRMVYAADSLALATLELTVHLTGARITYTAIELDVPGRLVGTLEHHDLTIGWRDDEAETAAHGDGWLATGSGMALKVPSAVVDVRSGEHNVLLNPTHPRFEAVTEVQRFDVVLDERL